MLIEAIPKFGRHYRPLCQAFQKIISCSSSRKICTASPVYQKNSQAWDYIVPILIRAFRNNAAKRDKRAQCKSHDWENWETTLNKWAKDIQKEFSSENVHDMTHGEKVKFDSAIFEVNLDTRHYTPEELQVKIVGDKLTVKGKHGEKHDEYGSISRQFHRIYHIPEEVKIETFETALSDEGILTLRADVEGAEKSKKTVEIKFEPKKEH